MNGCDDLSQPFGFNSDFTVTFITGGPETHWHMDCPGPIINGAVCTMSRVYLVPNEPDPAAAVNPNPTLPVQTQYPLPPNTTNAPNIDRRLAVGAWPPAIVSRTWDSSACPVAGWANLPSTTVSPSDASGSDAALRSVIASLPASASASVNAQAFQACLTSAFCSIGYGVLSGTVFQSLFWGSATLLSQSINQRFTKTITPKGMRSFWASFSEEQATSCTTSYSKAVCGLNLLPTFSGNGDYTCNPWNTQDIVTGSQEIMQKCANSCEMLQWYFSWWQNYRVGVHPRTTNPLWYDGANYKYVQDYCGAADPIACDSIDNPSVCGSFTQDIAGNRITESGAIINIENPGRSFAIHPKCWSGQPIPLCESPNIALASADC
jgi:hypothetical protein